MGKFNRQPFFPKQKWLVSLSALVVAGTVAGGFLWHSREKPQAAHHEHHPEAESAETGLKNNSHDPVGEQVYVCPMHPQVRQSSSGRCPICGMDLVATDDSSSTKKHGHTEQILATAPPPGSQTAVVKKRTVSPRIHTWARVAVDGANEFVVTAPADGWVRQLSAQRAGQTVNAGDPLFEFFSPELYQRQRDYIDTLNRRDQLAQSITDMSGQNAEVLGSLARERKRQRDALLRIGIASTSIDALEQFRRPLETLAVASPYAGKIIAVDARQGLAAGPGAPLYRIVDNSVVQMDVVLTPAQLAAVRTPVSVRLSDSEAGAPTPVDIQQAAYDNTLQSYTVRVALPTAQKNILPTGAVRDVDIVAEPQEMLAVPREAILENPAGSFVVVETDEHRYAVKKVEKDVGDTHWVGIKQGLEPGDKVVTEGQFLLDAAATFQQSFSQSVAD